MVWTRENTGERRKKISSLDDEGLRMIDRDRDSLNMVLFIRLGVRFYCCGGFSQRGRG